MNRSLLFGALGLLLAIAALVGCAGDRAVRGGAGQTAEHEIIDGVWVWSDKTFRDAENTAALLAFFSRYGFDVAAVHVGITYHDDGRATIDHRSDLQRFLLAAADQGLAVLALRGDPVMAYATNHERELSGLQAIIAFNAQLPTGAGLAGIRYDIEPYGAARWRQGGAQRLAVQREFLDFLHKARIVIERSGHGFKLTADTPFWYDNDELMLTYLAEHKRFSEHVLDAVDEVALMSYRPKGAQIVELVQNEVDYAAKVGKTVYAGVETGHITGPEAFISFHGRPTQQYFRETEIVREQLAGHRGFGGIYHHYYGSLVTYLDGKKPY